MQAVLNAYRGPDKVFLFVPVVNKKLAELIEELEFAVERYSFVLVREDVEMPALALREDYEIRPFKSGRDEEVWCEVRNAGFANLQGSERRSLRVWYGR